MQKISACLWYDKEAEEAVRFYISVFNNSKIISEIRMPGNSDGEKGAVVGINFELDGVGMMALNGDTEYKFNPAVSLFVSCKDQEEVDRLWDRLLQNGGKEMQCGWITDRYGVSWQIVPEKIGELMNGKDPVRSGRAFNAMMKMVKLDIAKLQQAYDGV
jgi:predicted 3-demethylubiquinone-9 3-methyltransferase (glyoxalase superfamily)